MESHKQVLDKEYENLLTSFRKELEKLHLKHQQELERKVIFIFRLEFYLLKKIITAEAKPQQREETNERD